MVFHKPLFSIEMYAVGRQGLEPRTKGLCAFWVPCYRSKTGDELRFKLEIYWS